MAAAAKSGCNRRGVAVSERVDRTVDPTSHHAVDDAPGLAVFRTRCEFVSDFRTRVARVHRFDSHTPDGHRMSVGQCTRDLDAVGSNDRPALVSQTPIGRAASLSQSSWRRG